jgi:hypothetical protein
MDTTDMAVMATAMAMEDGTGAAGIVDHPLWGTWVWEDSVIGRTGVRARPFFLPLLTRKTALKPPETTTFFGLSFAISCKIPGPVEYRLVTSNA